MAKRRLLQGDQGETSGSATVRVERAYIQGYEDKWRQDDGRTIRPKIEHGRDRKLLKKLIETWDEETVTSLLRDFFATTSPRVTRTQYEVKDFYYTAQGLLQDRTRRRATGRTADNLHEAAKALERKPR